MITRRGLLGALFGISTATDVEAVEESVNDVFQRDYHKHHGT
jgi:hypothetical protein